MFSKLRLSTRLLLPLLLTVVLVMAVYGYWAQRRREIILTAQARSQTNAYAAALGLALEAAFRNDAPEQVQSIIDRISREPTIYGVVVYGPDAEMLFLSDPLRFVRQAPLRAVREVLSTGQPAGILRDIEGESFYSVLRVIEGDDRPAGAFEVVQPLDFVREETQRTRIRFLLNTLTLSAALTVLFLWLIRRLVGRPLERLVPAVQALGDGNLSHRIDLDVGSAELADLATEFNRMADRLARARASLETEADERIALARRLRESEKMAAVGTLAAGLAHEIAAPLHVIRGRAELMLGADAPADVRERNLRIISEQSARITAIVRNLLDFARRREPQLEPVDLSALLADVIEFLGSESAAAGIEVTQEGAAHAQVQADPQLLHQVFMNLLMNALHAVGQRAGQGRVSARVSTVHDAETNESAVIVDIEDNGGGVAEDLLPRIFEPFVTTKTADAGTGLGLVVARSIVEEHAGTLDVVNIDIDGGRGARFRVTLPAGRTEQQDV